MNNSNAHIRVLVQLAKVDGEASHEELELIREIGSSQNVSPSELEDALSNIGDTTYESLENFSEEEKIDMINDLIDVTLADGRIDESELSFCYNVVERLGLNREVFSQIVSEVQDKHGLGIGVLSKEKLVQYFRAGSVLHKNSI